MTKFFSFDPNPVNSPHVLADHLKLTPKQLERTSNRRLVAFFCNKNADEIIISPCHLIGC
jgi:hypothetical protein